MFVQPTEREKRPMIEGLIQDTIDGRTSRVGRYGRYGCFGSDGMRCCGPDVTELDGTV